MNINKIVSFFLMIIFCGKTFTQTILAGNVLDENKNPLAYVSIGIPRVNIDTYSFEGGSFELKINNLNLNDSVQFSHISHKTKRITVNKLIDLKTIYLESDIHQFNEVIIDKNHDII